MNRVRVAHVALDLDVGGLERLVADMIRTTDRQRFDLHLVVFNFLGRNAEGLEAFATLHQAPPLPRWTMLWPAPLTALFRRIAPDVLHTHSGVWHKASLAARHAGVPLLVHTEHGRSKFPDPWRDRMADRLAAGRTDVVVAVSDAAAKQITGPIVRDGSKVRVIRNGVDADRFSPAPKDPRLLAELGLTADTPLIGSTGRFDPIKGYDIVLDAFQLLRSRWASGAPPVLLLVGDGPEREALEAQARRLGLGDGVRFLGWRSEILPILRLLDVFTLGSHSEGTSVSLLEAMSAQVCPVVTAVGGNPAVLGPALAHRLVPPARHDLLAAAWEAALHSPEVARADAALARRRVLDEYSLAAMVREYEAIYTGAARRPAP